MKPHGILVALLLCKGQFSHHLLLTSICGAIFFGINISQEFLLILHLQDDIDGAGWNVQLPRKFSCFFLKCNEYDRQLIHNQFTNYKHYWPKCKYMEVLGIAQNKATLFTTFLFFMSAKGKKVFILGSCFCCKTFLEVIKVKVSLRASSH